MLNVAVLSVIMLIKTNVDHYIKTLFCILLQFSLFMLSDVDMLSDVAMLSAVARLSVVILGPWGLYYKTFYDRNLRIFQPGSPV